jgi:hypothetical protein
MLLVHTLNLHKNIIITELPYKNSSSIVFTGSLGSIKIGLFDKSVHVLKRNALLYLICNHQGKITKKKLSRFNFAFCALNHSLAAIFFPVAFYLRLVGVGFKIIKSNNIAFFIKKEGRLQQLGFCSFLLNKVSNRLAQTYTHQKPSAYTGKGLLYLGIEPSRKEGKGKFQR